MNNDQDAQATAESAAEQQAPRHNPRRRKLLGGVAASPLLLSVASRPAWANGAMCTPSALASANLSGQHDFEGCSISAGFWKTNPSTWPVSPDTYFHFVFDKVAFNGNVLYEKNSSGSPSTLFDVINRNFKGENPGNLAFPLVGAYLNALQFPYSGGAPGYPYSAEDIVRAFNALGQTQAAARKGKNQPNTDDLAFANLKDTLDEANNKFDDTTEKPSP